MRQARFVKNFTSRISQISALMVYREIPSAVAIQATVTKIKYSAKPAYWHKPTDNSQISVKNWPQTRLDRPW